jgi:hypothetical protein
MIRNLVVTLVALLILAPVALAGYSGDQAQQQAPQGKIVVNVPPPADEGFFSDTVVAALIAGSLGLLGVAITVKKRR